MGLHYVITWVLKLGFKDVVFEMVAKFVVDAFNSKSLIISEFGFLMNSCKSFLLSFNYNSHVEFDKRNANKVVHTLARVALLSASLKNTLISLHVFPI